jgi:hypothetical protein
MEVFSMTALSRQTIGRFSLALCMVVAMLPLTSCVITGSRMSETRTLDATYVPGELFNVNTANGSVQILVEPDRESVLVEAKVTASAPTVEEAEARLADIDVIIDHRESDRGAELFLTAEFEGGRRSNEGCSFVITTPGSAGVLIRTSNGSVKVHGSDGEADVDTGNGTVTITDQQGPVRVDTSNGTVTVQRAAGSVDVETSNGRIVITDCQGPCTGQTSNGSVKFTAAAESNDAFSFRTSNGSITVYLPATMKGQIETSTSNGRVSLITENGSQSGKSRTIRLSDSGAVSHLSTSNGSIQVNVKDES